MKLKYYLRGLGIGILVTVLILSFSPGEKEVLSDAEIRERALQLGMVDSNSLMLTDVSGINTDKSELKQDKTEKTEVENEETDSKESQGQIEGSADNQKEDVNTVVNENEDSDNTTAEQLTEAEDVKDAQTTDTVEQNNNAEIVTITVESGVHSYTVCKDLEAAGLIEDAKAFDDYLCNNGYSRSVCVGTYKIPLGTSEEEIAKIISRKR